MTNTGNKDTRSGFGAGLYEIGKKDPRVVALCADLIGSLKMEAFAEAFPQRFFQCGIAEANMMGTAAGLAVTGKIPFVGTFAEFATGRVYDQVRQSICYSQTNVKIAASHAGITLGEDGATHQTMEDIALMRAMPHMTVINPCDYNQTRLATMAAAEWKGPVYLRFGRPSVPNFTPADGPYEIGKAWLMEPGEDVTILATGHLVWEALEAVKILGAKGIKAELINIHTIKPLDMQAIIDSARKTGAVVTAEEHLVAGGLGELVAGVLARHCPVPMRMVAMEDGFGQSGTPAELMNVYGLNAANIVAKVCELR
ncbi:MAG: transketolase family protein [Bacteroidales bacterium]|jgi:transketolase|nr:transketolase family protein [Bacteroidales bacterium]MDD4256347.1 transketolase family protein [Bacteroidales bacterium]MDD4827227.1 transketolase family protein [Bacteroidales bacterium]HNY23992.1 transketolase family protein [Bacteroidales bacterium]